VSRWSGFRNAALAAALLLTGFAGAQAQISLQAGAGHFAVPVRTWRDIPFRTVVRQEYDYSCGSAALATLLRYHYGRAVGEAEIFKAMYLAGDQQVIRKVGFSLLDMKNYLRGIGLGSDGYRSSVAEVAADGEPAITVISTGGYKHFVVIKGVRNGEVLIGDPAGGLRAIDQGAFEKMWNGIVFVVHDPASQKPVFNASAEWRPYAPGPLELATERSLSVSAGTGLPVVYQVLQLTPLSPLP
jgi:predicted double-glycine peptidase